VIIPDETGRKVVLANLSRMDAGLYICTADNQVDQGVEKITKITVNYPPEAAIEEVWVPHGTTFEVRLVCQVTSFPSAKVTWFKNENTKLSTSDEIVIENQEPKFVLKIEKLKVNNFGSYKCKASNMLGSTEVSLDITGKPRPPIFSGDQREILSSVKELNITWSTDSMLPITQYLLAYRKSQVSGKHANCLSMFNFVQTGIIQSSSSPSSSWSQSVIPVEISKTSLTSFSSYNLKNLDNETVYDVRVRAVNKFGMSKFSKVFNFYVKTSVISGSPRCPYPAKSACPSILAGEESDISPRLLLTEAKEVTSSGSSTISIVIPVMCALITFHTRYS